MLCQYFFASAHSFQGHIGISYFPAIMSTGSCTWSQLQLWEVNSAEGPWGRGVFLAALKAALHLFQTTKSKRCCHLKPEAEALVWAELDGSCC